MNQAVAEPRSNEPTEAEILEYMMCAPKTFEAYKYFAITHCKTMDVDAPEGEDKVKLIPDARNTDEVIKMYMSPDDEMLKKSRQQMASWIFCACELKDVIFSLPNDFSWVNLSKKSSDVDDTTYESLHGKIAFMHSQLPEHLKRDLKVIDCFIENKKTGNFINGVATTSDAARAGGYTGGLIDEGQKIPFFRLTFTSMRFAVKKRLKIIFTAAEEEKAAIELMYADPNNGFHKYFLHWSLYRDRAWFERVSKSLTKAEIDRELEGKPGGSSDIKVWPAFNRATHVKDNLYRPNLPIKLSGDFGYSDPTWWSFYQANMDELYHIDEYQGARLTTKEHVEFIYNKLAKYSKVDPEGLKYWQVEGTDSAANALRAKYKAVIKENLCKIEATGDPTGRNNQETSGTSPIAEYADWGLNIITKEKTDMVFGITQGDLRLKESKFFIDTNCPMTIEIFQSYSYPTSADGKKKEGENPKHDEYSHGGAACRYIFENNPLKPIQPAVWHKKDKPIAAFQSRIGRLRRAHG